MKHATNRWGTRVNVGRFVVAHHPRGGHIYGVITRRTTDRRLEVDNGHTIIADDVVSSAAIRCYDNGGKTADRYTVVYLDQPAGVQLFDCVGMSAGPMHPQGIGQHGTAQPGKHLGKVIPFLELPEDCRRLVYNDVQGDANAK